MTKLEEARINAQWAGAMLETGNYPAGMYPGQVETMKAEFEAIIAEEEAKTTTEEGTEQ